MFDKNKIHYALFLISLIFLLQLLQGCSPESGNPLAKNYHNTTARYNAYFIAKEKMKEVEGIIYKNNVDDFNKILNVFPTLKLEDTAQIKAPAEECIKKASIAIQRHKNSKWTDRSFNLIGMSRFYLKDYKNAIETFKYVNTKGKDKNAKHAALISLMRLFIETKDYESAVSVATFLRKEKLNKANTRDFNLNKAYYFAQNGDYHKTESYIGFAIPYINDLNLRSRLYFIIGQIRQKNGDDQGAYASYKSAVKNNPTYTIAFYSRLNMTQVSQVGDKGDVKKIEKNFAKLLKDIRNEDFKDKIYFEMAKFELKRDHMDKAIAFLEQSIRASTINNKQKALSYLKLGELYYEKLKKYELAKSYYDSTVNFLTPQDEEYNMASRRQKSLVNFVAQINTINMEDSLRRFSKMDSITLHQYLAKIEEDQAAQAKKNVGKTSGDDNFSSVFDNMDIGANNNISPRSTQSDDPGNWYFYSAAALSRGRSQFIKVWGNRPLEDNWRRSKKESSNDQEAESGDSTSEEQNPIASSSGADSEVVGGFNKKQFLSQIPRTPEQIESSDKKIEDAYFTLGKIYDQELNESSNSIQTFETLLKRFPQTEYKAEIYYYLYLLSNKVQSANGAEQYKKKLAEEFPTSLYNKLINNPNYLTDNKKEEKIVAALYQQVYSLYEMDSLKRALVKIDSISRIYPDNNISDKFSLLKVLVKAKYQNIPEYQQSLNQFINDYPESNLIPYAQELLKASESTDVFKPNVKVGTLYKPDNENSVHYFSIIYSGNEVADDSLRSEVLKFNLENFPDRSLNIEIENRDNQEKMLLVKDFPNKSEAMDYHARFKEDSSLLGKFKDLNLNVFIISQENFQTFNQSKDLKSYLSFFEKTY